MSETEETVRNLAMLACRTLVAEDDNEPDCLFCSKRGREQKHDGYCPFHIAYRAIAVAERTETNAKAD